MSAIDDHELFTQAMERMRNRHKSAFVDIIPINETPISEQSFDFREQGDVILIKPYNQLKRYRTYTVASAPNYYQMDIVFFGQYVYLIVVGTNNRYVWTAGIPDRITVTIDKALDVIIGYPSFRKSRHIYIDSDKEPSFFSMKSGKYEYAPGVTVHINAKKDEHHNRLSVLNRVVRTIRSYAFNKSHMIDIPPKLLGDVLSFYNHEPHQTLSTLVGFNVSPADLLNDPDLEAFAARSLLHTNLANRHKKFKIGDIVKVYHEVKDRFEKRRLAMEEGVYRIINLIGNMYEVRDIDDEEAETEIFPGYLMTKI
jgi:hypothetical protein